MRSIDFGGDQLHGRKITAVPPRVARQQWQLLNRGMGTNKKISKDAGANPARTAVSRVSLAGQKQSRPRYRNYGDAGADERGFKIFDAGIASRRLRVDNVIDQQRSFQGGLLQPG